MYTGRQKIVDFVTYTLKSKLKEGGKVPFSEHDVVNSIRLGHMRG